MQPFRQALDDKDTEALEALLADDVVFSSPMVCSEHPGKAVTIAFLRAVLQVFEDFRCVREFDDVGGRDRAFVLEAEFEGKKVAGCVFLHFDEDGRIDDFMAMVWPPLGRARARGRDGRPDPGHRDRRRGSDRR